jgi:hypothetical protein
LGIPPLILFGQGSPSHNLPIVALHPLFGQGITGNPDPDIVLWIFKHFCITLLLQQLQFPASCQSQAQDTMVRSACNFTKKKGRKYKEQ